MVEICGGFWLLLVQGEPKKESFTSLTARATMRRLGTETTRRLHRCRVRSDLDASFRVADERAISVGGSDRIVSDTAKAAPNFGGPVGGIG